MSYVNSLLSSVVFPLVYHGLPHLPCKGRHTQAPNATTLTKLWMGMRYDFMCFYAQQCTFIRMSWEILNLTVTEMHEWPILVFLQIMINAYQVLSIQSKILPEGKLIFCQLRLQVAKLLSVMCLPSVGSS